MIITNKLVPIIEWRGGPQDHFVIRETLQLLLSRSAPTYRNVLKVFYFFLYLLLFFGKGSLVEAESANSYDLNLIQCIISHDRAQSHMREQNLTISLNKDPI